MHFTPGLMAHLFKQRQVFLDSTVGTGDHNTERPHAQPLEGVGMPSRVFHWAIGGRRAPRRSLGSLGPRYQ